MIDVQNIRKDFPILERKINGSQLVYLDNAATTQKPRQVIDSLVNYYENSNSNVHRGVHSLSMEATDLFEEAREKVSSFIMAPRLPLKMSLSPMSLFQMFLTRHLPTNVALKR